MRGRASERRARRTSRILAIEALEDRALMASDLRFAVIGDFSASQAALDVSNQVKSWNPAFVATVGDNNYPVGAAATIDANVGQYYHQFMSPYHGTFGAGSADGVNHFFPALGGKDWIPANAQPYLNYFNLPQNGGGGRYYSVTQGKVAIFVLDSDPSEPDLAYNGPTDNVRTSQSREGTWLKNQLAASSATYKIVLMHQPAYSSGVVGNGVYMQWPFQQWGATAVISGHDHDYERLSEGGLPYFVDGLGGNEEGISGFNAPIPGSQTRFNADNGAMLVDATDNGITFQFVARSGAVVDTYTIGTAAAPSAPTNLSAVAGSAFQVNLSWTDNAHGNDGFQVERSTDGTTFTPIGTTALGVTSFSDGNAAPGTRYTYRVLATVTTNGTQALNSGYSATASATTPGLPQTSPTYLSDLSWVSAVSGYLTVQKDKSVFGNSLSLNGLLNGLLGGVTYSKGLGTHANSQIVYNLGGQYSTFVTDVGIDTETVGGTVDFQIQADGRTIYDSGLVLGGTPARHVALDVVGVNQLSLLVNDAGDGNAHDHADFAGARLYHDTSAPTTSATVAGPLGSHGIYTGPVSVRLSASDPDNIPGSLTITYRLDNAAAVPYVSGSSIAIAGNGTHTLAYQASDKAGNLESTKTLLVAIDTTAPTTSATVAGPTGTNGWYTGPVSVSLATIDPSNLPIVPTITYQLDHGPITVYVPGQPIPISTDGFHTVSYQARDEAGNLEAAKSLTISIDATAPTTTARLAGTSNSNGRFTGPVTVTLAPIDATSGVSSTTYQIDGGHVMVYDPSHPFVISAAGSHHIVFQSRDAAGNLEALNSIDFTIGKHQKKHHHGDGQDGGGDNQD